MVLISVQSNSRVEEKNHPNIRWWSIMAINKRAIQKFIKNTRVVSIKSFLMTNWRLNPMIRERKKIRKVLMGLIIIDN